MSTLSIDNPLNTVISATEGRYYVSNHSRNSDYLLPADQEEVERLAAQAQHINKMFDNKLIWAPITLNDFKDGDIILDSATGSGTWVLNIANQVPFTVKLIGLDIEHRMFPPSYPSNVSLNHGSVTSLPDEWSSSITFINQRLLVCALQEKQWKSALQEMHRVMVPGGWAQLLEMRFRITSPSREIRNHLILLMAYKLAASRDINLDITDNLPSLLEECGFVNIRIDERKMMLGSWAGEEGKDHRSALGFFQGMKGMLAREKWLGMVGSEEQWDASFDDFVQKCEETPGTYFCMCSFVAHKAL